MPRDKAVTKIGNLFKTDPCNSADDIAKNTQIYDVVRQKNKHECYSSSGDYLVVMDNFVHVK